MADSHAPASTSPAAQADSAAEMLAERQGFWNTFVGSATYGIAAVAILLLALAVLFG